MTAFCRKRVDRRAPVGPLPTWSITLRAFAIGFAGTGLPGWRRKRKAQAAARSIYLIGFQRDRREEVFLFALMCYR
jgi:hypothetical protein